MHDVTPKVVAMAVSTVITMWRILLQMLLFSILLFQLIVFCGCFLFLGTDYTDYTEPFLCLS